MNEVFEKIIDKMESYSDEDKCNGCVPVVALTDAIEIVMQASDEYNNGWIPCSERLPEEPFGCLVTVIDTNPVTMEDFENILPYFVGYDGEQWNDAGGEQLCFEVIAWQPLPEPYQPNICISADCPINDGKECLAAEGGAGFEPRKQTNADRIRFMSDEELAKFIAELSEHCLAGVGACDCSDIKENPCYKVCEKVARKWLQSEVEE